MSESPSPVLPLSLDTRVTLSIAEAALVLGVSERTLRSVLHEVPHFRIGQRILIPVEGLRQWVMERARAREAAEQRTADEILKALGS